MSQDVNRVAHRYDWVAAEYAKTFSGEHEKKPMDQEMLDRFVEQVGDRAPVWDFGCGPGDTTQYLVDAGLEISGLDLSEKMLAQARSNHPDIYFQQGNLLDLSFKDQSIAGIVAFYAIVHFSADQVEKTFCEIYRVLQPGGVFLFTYHVGDTVLHVDEFLGQNVDIDFMFHSSASITTALEKVGFEHVVVTEREPYPDVEYASRRAYVFAATPSVDPAGQRTDL